MYNGEAIYVIFSGSFDDSSWRFAAKKLHTTLKRSSTELLWLLEEDIDSISVDDLLSFFDAVKLLPERCITGRDCFFGKGAGRYGIERLIIVLSKAETSSRYPEGSIPIDK
jgi:hypothetical protein